MSILKKTTPFIIFFIYSLYSYFSFTVNKGELPIYSFKEEIDNVKAINTVSYDLSPQDYFLKIKFGDKPSIRYEIYYNNALLENPTVRRSKNGILALNFMISSSTVKEKNTLEIKFKNSVFPDNLDIRISNFKKTFGNDIFIFSRNFTFRQPLPLKSILFFSATFLACIFIFRSIIVFMPVAIFMLLLQLAPFFTPYRILVDKLYFGYLVIFGIAIFIVIFLAKHMVKSKRFIFSLLLVIITMAGFFLLSEFLTRIYIKRHYQNSLFRLGDKFLGYKLAFHYQGYLQNAFVTTNAFGLRNKEIPLNKPKNMYRIVCLGDSITFGFDLPDDKSYVNYLEKELNGDSSKKYTYETINFGVPAYNTYQERLILENDALSFQPDMVILQVCLNDMTTGISIPSIVNTLLGFDAYGFNNMSIMGKLNYLCARHSYFYQYLILKSRAIFRKYTQKPMVGLYAKEDIEMFSGKRKAYFEDKFYEELVKIKDKLAILRIAFLVVIFPNDIQFTDSNLCIPQKKIIDFCSKNNIECLDLLPVFLKHKDKHILIDIGHPSEYGNLLAAKEIMNFLKENSLKQYEF